MPAPVPQPTDTPAAAAQAPDDLQRVSDAVMATWQRIDATLAPVIGPRGVAALFKRSLFLAAPSHAWLDVAQEGVRPALDLTELRGALARQSAAEAAAGSALLLATFATLLASLIGASLTERLLRPVSAAALAPPSSDLPP
ncbi:MAG TPA: hypothetical protein VLA16_20935, partial [Ideonella sp.]|nr:hypothetical protein [Ideonella sp.]